MNAKKILLSLSVVGGVETALATVINVPDGNFQNVSASLAGPLILGTTSGSIGTWSAQFSDLLSAGGQIASSNAATAGWVSPPGGCTYELQMNFPASAGSTATISESVPAQLQPNSVYRLSVDLSQQSTLNLLGNSTLSLYTGSTNLASAGGTNLLSIETNSSGYQAITLTYKTGNHVPNTTLGVSFAASGAASLAGTIYVDNFQMTVNPVQVQLSSTVIPSHTTNGAASLTLNGSGGAPGAIYQIATCTNLFHPSTVWVQVVTNQFDTNGNFSQSFTVNPNVICQFFKATVPAN